MKAMAKHSITVSKNDRQLTDNKNGRLHPEKIYHEKKEENG